MAKTNTEKVRECRQKNYDMVQFQVSKGERERLRDYAESKGMNLAGFIRLAVRHAMDTDFPPAPPSSN